MTIHEYFLRIFTYPQFSPRTLRQALFFKHKIEQSLLFPEIFGLNKGTCNNDQQGLDQLLSSPITFKIRIYGLCEGLEARFYAIDVHLLINKLCYQTNLVIAVPLFVPQLQELSLFTLGPLFFQTLPSLAPICIPLDVPPPFESPSHCLSSGKWKTVYFHFFNKSWVWSCFKKNQSFLK